MATFAVLACAQNSLTAEPGSDHASDGPVLTIHGICSWPDATMPSPADECTALVPRQRFETLIRIVAPEARSTPAEKQSIAKTYAELLAFQQAAEKSGIAASPEFQTAAEWSRLKILAALYRRDLEKHLTVVSDQEIDRYYLLHISDFEEIKLRRMLVPKSSLASLAKEDSEAKALELAMEFRERAANGADMDQLQKEAYIAAGLNNMSPTTDVGARRRSSLTLDVRDDVFALRSGEVSKVEKETYSYVIYKVEAKRTLPKETVRDEISRAIAREKLDAALRSVRESVHADLNVEYFGQDPVQ